MEEKYKDVLENHLDDICDKLDTEVVVKRLKRAGVLHKRDEEFILSHRTAYDRNEKLVDVLKKLGERAFPSFMVVLRETTGHLGLASELVPVTCEVLWLTASQRQAAVVLHELNGQVLFGDVQNAAGRGGGGGVLFRKGCVENRPSVVVTLLMPPMRDNVTTPSLHVATPISKLLLMLEEGEAIRQFVSSSTVVVACGVCEDVEGRYNMGDVLADDVTDVPLPLINSPSPPPPPVLRPIPTSLRKQALWLARLYRELRQREGEEEGGKGERERAASSSRWLDEVGWTNDDPAQQQALLSQKLPQWSSGRLPAVLLHRGLWREDVTSALGMAPSTAAAPNTSQHTHSSGSVETAEDVACLGATGDGDSATPPGSPVVRRVPPSTLISAQCRQQLLGEGKKRLLCCSGVWGYGDGLHEDGAWRTALQNCTRVLWYLLHREETFSRQN